MCYSYIRKLGLSNFDSQGCRKIFSYTFFCGLPKIVNLCVIAPWSMMNHPLLNHLFMDQNSTSWVLWMEHNHMIQPHESSITLRSWNMACWKMDHRNRWFSIQFGDIFQPAMFDYRRVQPPFPHGFPISSWVFGGIAIHYPNIIPIIDPIKPY